MKTFTMTTEHPLPEYTFTDERIEAFQDSSTLEWYAIHPGLGCSKSRATPGQAITLMLQEHGCRITKLAEIQTGDAS